MAEQKPVQSKMTMILIGLFVGQLGIHRLMMGYSNWWLQLITFGGCGITIDRSISLFSLHK